MTGVIDQAVAGKARADGADAAEAPEPVAAPGPKALRGERRGISLSWVVGACFALWGGWLGIQALSDNSFFTHLATGRLIWETGGIPRADPYSYTAAGEPWVVQSWLASWLYAGAERLGDLGAVRLLNAAVTALLAALVWRLTRPALSLVPRIAIAAGALATGAAVWAERPLLFGLLALAVVLWAIAEDGIDPRWLVPVGWMWLNVHGSFPLGLAVAGLFGLGAWLDGERTWERLVSLRESRVLAWLSLGLAAGVANPLGPRLLVFPLSALDNRASFSAITEWQPPDFDSAGQLAFLVMAVAVVAVMVRRPSWRLALPAIVFVVASLFALRNLAPASLVLVVVLAHGTAGLGTLSGVSRRPLHAVLAGVVGVAAVVGGTGALRGPDVRLDAYPEEALAWMEDRSLLDQRVLSQDFVGNLLEARTGQDRDRAPVFIDDRVDMYPADVVDDYLILMRGEPGWAGVLERWEPSSVVWASDEPLAQVLEASPSWRDVYRDDDWVVFRPSALD